MPGCMFVCLFGTFLCIDGTTMMQRENDGTTVVKFIFLHLTHPNICLQAEEKAQAQRKEQTRAPEEAETGNARREVLLSL